MILHSMYVYVFFKKFNQVYSIFKREANIDLISDMYIFTQPNPILGKSVSFSLCIYVCVCVFVFQSRLSGTRSPFLVH